MWINDPAEAKNFNEALQAICASLNGFEIDSQPARHKLTLASFGLTTHLNAAVVLLTQQGLRAGALALTRTLREAGLRTTWFYTSATNLQITKIASGRQSVLPELGELQRVLLRAADPEVQGRSVGILSNFTHAGLIALHPLNFASQATPEEIAVTYAGAAMALASAARVAATVLERGDVIRQLHDWMNQTHATLVQRP